MSYMPYYTQKCQWVRTQHEKKKKRQNVKKEDAKAGYVSSWVEGRQ